MYSRNRFTFQNLGWLKDLSFVNHRFYQSITERWMAWMKLESERFSIYSVSQGLFSLSLHSQLVLERGMRLFQKPFVSMLRTLEVHSRSVLQW